jgi:hypothetical protein
MARVAPVLVRTDPDDLARTAARSPLLRRVIAPSVPSGRQLVSHTNRMADPAA